MSKTSAKKTTMQKFAAGMAAAAAPAPAAPAATPAPAAPGAAPAQGFDINKTLQGAGNWLGQQTTNLGQSLNLNPQQIAMIKQYAPYLLGGAALGGIGGYMTDGFGGALKGMLLGGGAGAAGKYGLDQYNEYQAKPEIGEDEVQEWRKQQGLVNPA